jgi:hypothetical protein
MRSRSRARGPDTRQTAADDPQVARISDREVLDVHP